MARAAIWIAGLIVLAVSLMGPLIVWNLGGPFAMIDELRSGHGVRAFVLAVPLTAALTVAPLIALYVTSGIWADVWDRIGGWRRVRTDPVVALFGYCESCERHLPLVEITRQDPPYIYGTCGPCKDN